VCFVIEDATSGVQAAKAGGIAAIGVARLGDQQQLADVGADLVVPTLDDVSLPALLEGRLEERQAADEIRRRYAERPANVWTLVYDGFDPGRQGLREALCALGNGYFVTRGALPEAKADEVNYPGTYVAGLYNRLTSNVAGRQVENEDLVNQPNWLSLQFRVAGGPWFDMQQPGVEDHRLELDMKHGTLIRSLTGRTPWGDEPRWCSAGSLAVRTSTLLAWRPSSQLRTGQTASRSAPGWTAGWSTRASSATAT
jgi:hypothetical protein